ncbi:MAG: arsenic transporter, partial [Oscillospiraceae bacterium]|nr:arsenic transporter [Oscillospiraceae bacterium]
MKALALCLFILTYILMIALPKYRPWVAVVSGALFIILGYVSPKEALASIDCNVLLMLAGTMGTVSLFIQSKMPNRIAEMLLEKVPNVMWAAAVMSLFAGVVSAFVDNVATVLMLAPVGIAIATRLGISPVPLLICIAVSSNLQGAATLVGDTTSIMLGGYAGMNFLDFFFMDGKFSIFWAVELGALATIPIVLFIFRRQREPVELQERTDVTDYVPSILLGGTVLLLIVASFIPNTPDMINGYICVAVFLVGVVYTLIRDKDAHSIKRALVEIAYPTLCLLAGLFVV